MKTKTTKRYIHVALSLFGIFANHAFANPGAWDRSYVPALNGGAVNAMALQPDGKLLIGGAFTAVNNSSSRSHLARLFADGTLDTTFFNSGSGVSSTIYCLAVQTDGRIVIGGDFTSVNGTARRRVARMNPNGSVDGSFVPTNTISGPVLALAAQSDNKLIIGGSFSGGFFPSWNARLNADGTVDTAFSSYPNGPVNAIAMQTDGKIVIGGAFTSVNGALRNRIARLNPDGSLDNTFQNGLAGASGIVWCVQIQADGKILIGGDFTSVNNMARGFIARLNANGSLDTGFASSPGANAPVYAITVQTDNSIAIAGGFSTYGSYSLSRVARLYADGTRDTSFSTFGINNLVQALAVQGDGALLAGGTFTTINNTNRPYLARLYGNLYPPEFVSQPISRSTNVGATVTFSAVVNNPTPSIFQWRKDGSNISGATGTSYTLYDVQFADAGNYSVFVSNAAGGSTSSNAVLNVGIAPSFTSQPLSLTVTQGQSATFTVGANGIPLAYFWRKNGAFIPGATNTNFTISSATGSDAAAYTVVVSNFLKSVTSASAVLTVIVPVSITAQPISQTVGEGSNMTFTVGASGTSRNYQWFKGGAKIPGATASSYTINNVQFNDAGDYSVTVTNILTSVTSQIATLTVQRYAPAIIVQPASQNIPVGSNVTFGVGATGTTLKYQWQKDATNILDATGLELSLTNIGLTDAGGYSVIITNPIGSVTSVVANLNAGYAPVIVQQPYSVTNYLGGTVSFSCTVTGSTPMKLQWLFNSAPIPDQTNATLVLTNLESSDFGFFALAATNIFGGTISAVAQLRNPAVRKWIGTGGLFNARILHTATLLKDGRVLIIGGYDRNQTLFLSTELYDPANGTWTPAGAMTIGRYLHTATLLPNGKILVAGGASTNGIPVNSTELFDPATRAWTVISSLNTPRYTHTATLLPNGKVFVTAGVNLGGFLASSEIFDPQTGTWTLGASMAAPRAYHSASLLPDGKLVVAAGYNGSLLASAELFDSATGTWTVTSNLTTARWFHTATLLPNGKVLVAGGGSSGDISSAELFDPATETWKTTDALTTARGSHTATLLPDGETLVVGGVNSSGALSSAELYGVARGTWRSADALTTARWHHTATLLLDGRVLVAGGENSGGTLSSAELYDKAIADVTLSGFLQTYDGTAKNVTATTTPPGLPVDITYNGSSNAPINVGSYTVVAIINDLNFQGSTTNTLVIYSMPAPIALTVGTIQSSGAFQFAFTNLTGLSFSVLATTNLTLSMSSWTLVGSATEAPPGSGQFQFTDSQATNDPQRFYRIRSQ